MTFLAPGVLAKISLAGSLASVCFACPAERNAPAIPPESPAAFFPAHSFVYMQMNPFSGARGFQGLKLAKLLKDETIRDLIDEAMKQIPRDSDPRAMLKRYPFDRCIGDAIGMGLIGFAARSQGPGGRMLLFPEEGTITQELLEGRVNIQGRNLLAIRVEDERLFMATLGRLLGDILFDGRPPVPAVELVGKTKVNVWDLDGMKIYTKMVEGYFLASLTGQDLVAAVDRQAKRKASIASRDDFSRYQKHCGEDPSAFFVHIGLDSAIRTFSPLLPRADREMMAQFGAFDFSGLQMGMGFHDGGICESMHLAFAENPQGILMNLSRLWPSTGMIETKVKRSTVYAASLTFDWAALYGATMTILDWCAVDTRAIARDARDALGMDLRDDLMAALGNTMGAVMVIPNAGFIPEPSLVFKVRNRAKMEQVLAKIKRMCAQNGVRMKEFSVPGGGPKATYLDFGKDIPVKPAFALSGDKLVLSAMPLMLKYAIRKDRKTGKSVVDHVPDASDPKFASEYSFFADPAPLARDLYADLLKLLDSNRGALPIDPTELPEPDFVAASLSKFGVRFKCDAYFMALDLHSPAGIAIPMMIGGAVASAQGSGSAPAKKPRKKAIH